MSGESILVVEDDGIVALHIRDLLEKNNYRVSGAAAYGEDAVAMAHRDPPDLVLMDINLMGSIDGIEAAREIRRRADVPVIYLTGYSDSERLSRAKETSPYCYLVKPYYDEELLTAVEMALYRQTIDRKLHERIQRYRAIVDNAAESILLVSCDTKKIVEANPAVQRQLGYSAGELALMTPGDILRHDVNDERLAEDICIPGPSKIETQFRCRDGTLRDIELTTSLINYGGVPSLTCMIAHDVTDRKRAELALLKAHRKLNLLSSVTRHDILNQLTILYGFLEISGAAVAGTRNEEYVEKEKKAAVAIRRLITFTKDYEEIGQQSPGWQQPDSIIRRAAATIGSPGITINSRLEDLELFADPLLEKVFYNLLDNAIRHGEHTRTITIIAEPVAEGLLIRWDDDGAGVPDAEKKRIFERGVGKNTGLGLFLAREILSLTGITIEETGIFGKGARFDMVVPAGSFRYLPGMNRKP
jgi:PAS domain S-box-containing protein